MILIGMSLVTGWILNNRTLYLFWRGNMVKSTINEYVGVAPIDFLKMKLEREVNLNELLLLDHIIEAFDFEAGIANLFIEQVLKMNNNKFSRGFALKVAGEWDELHFNSLSEAQKYAEEEYEKFVQLQKRDNFGIIRELTNNEKEIVNRLYYKSSLNDDILDIAISYCMKINDGHIISWFINRLIEFFEVHDAQNKDEAQLLLNIFHKKYVVNFGIE